MPSFVFNLCLWTYDECICVYFACTKCENVENKCSYLITKIIPFVKFPYLTDILASWPFNRIMISDIVNLKLGFFIIYPQRIFLIIAVTCSSIWFYFMLAGESSSGKWYSESHSCNCNGCWCYGGICCCRYFFA